jgi:hypothetical protein
LLPCMFRRSRIDALRAGVSICVVLYCNDGPLGELPCRWYVGRSPH